MTRGETLAEKVWDRHVVRPGDGAASPICSTSTFTSSMR